MANKQKSKKSFLKKEFAFGFVTLTHKALFAKHLSVMLKAGLTIAEALKIIADSSKGRFKKIVQAILKSVESGQSLSASLARHPKIFYGLFIGAIQAGEASGNLEENLENLAEHLKNEKEMISKVKGAMLYPMVVLSAAFVLGLGMTFLVLPKIIPLFTGFKMELPINTRALIWFSYFIQNNATVLIIGLIAFIMIMIWLVRQKFIKPITHWLFLNSPVIKNIARNTNIARFCRTMGTMMQSGINIDESLDIIKNTSNNYYYNKALEQVGAGVGMGGSLSENLEVFEKLFPSIVTRMARVGEESGKLEETFLYLSDYYETEVDNATKALSTVVEPLLLVFIGLVVGFLALSIITPIYNITGGIGR